MLKLSVSEFIKNISDEICFEAVVEDYSFTLKIESYVPYVCAAIHDGHQFRKELWSNCLHSTYDRWYEEDPSTKQLIQCHPITIAGRDSRFEYDLNRDPETAIFETAWGKELWKDPLPTKQKELSRFKHQQFYKVVEALISKLEEKFGACIVYDMHSYNWKRWEREVPTFNLGTVNVDNERFGKLIEAWRLSLSEIHLPYDISATSKINDTFFGNGYFLKFITSTFKNTLVLATELKKIYCDELSGVIYPEIVATIEDQLKDKIAEHADLFYSTITK